MRILYVDVDTLRPDHLGCYGYHRRTSPNIDALAAGSLVFENVHASDVPCLPSRTAWLTGRFGIHNGVVNHGGTDADPAIDGADRGFWSRLHIDSFPSRLQAAGFHTVSVSSFAHRHSAFHWHAGFDETYNVGKIGLETADEVLALAADWLHRRGSQDHWFLHVHLWDPHTPYRAPASYGDPFADEPLPDWLTEEVRARDWAGCGPHSAQECSGFAPDERMAARFPRQPQQIPDGAAVRQMFDGYDTGVRMADDLVGSLLTILADLGVDGDDEDGTAIMVSSDHGEALGELNVYGDHQAADEVTTRIPMILRWPGLGAGTRHGALHYQFDVNATILDLLGQRVPSRWHGVSRAADWRSGRDVGRDHLVVSQAAWACQRGVRFDDWLYLETRHDAFHLWDDVMLFDVAADPHQQHDEAGDRPDVAGRGRDLLQGWLDDLRPGAARGRDPHDNVLAEGGPFHVRGQLPDYLTRLRATGRGALADRLDAR
jgi:arylsulfatase A-like enzyme